MRLYHPQRQSGLSCSLRIQSPNRAEKLVLLIGIVTQAYIFGVTSAQAQEESIEEAPITKYPQIIESAEAIYPPLALKHRIGAQVDLDLEISETGTISDIVVVKTTTVAETLSSTIAETYQVVRTSTTANYGFGAAAIAAVQRMIFSPAEAEGIPVAVRVPFTYTFELPPLPKTPPASEQEQQGQIVLQGTLRERGTRSVLPGVVITVFRKDHNEAAAGYEATSDAKGQFRFYDLKPGMWLIQGEADGYYPLRDKIDIVEDEITEVTYYLEKGSYSPYDIIVQADRIKREVNRRTLTREEIRTVAGTLGDPILVVENLPGVARPNTGSGNIIVRGSGTNDTRVYVDAIEVPIIYHFGGLKSVLPIDVVESVDFYPGNFSVFYGRGTGGVFDAHIRRLQPDQVHGAVELSALDVSAFLEAPIGKNVAVASGIRRSVIGDIIPAVVPDDADIGVISAPVYYDGQFILNWRPNREHYFRIFGLFSDDTLELLFENPSELSTQLSDESTRTSVNFQRVVLEHRFTPSEKFQNQALVALGRDYTQFGSFGFAFELDSLSLDLRNTAKWQVSEAIGFRLGLDVNGSLTDVLARLPSSNAAEGDTGGNPDLTTTIAASIADRRIIEFGGFIEAEWVPIEWLQIVPGVRVDYFELVNQWSADPRIVARIQLSEKLSIKGGVGAVYQPPTPAESIRPFGNPDAGLQRGIQYSLGTEFGFAENIPVLKNITVDLTFFYKDLDDLITSSDLRDEDGDPLFTSNSAIGRVYGLETFIEHKFADNFRGWLSYTFSRSERRDSPTEGWRLFDFDQTHILNLNTSYSLPNGWEIGLRWRLISGNPTTPSIPLQSGQTFFLSDLDQYSDVPGESNSERLPIFNQVDLRIEKNWIFNVLQFKAFLSLINTFNVENPEGSSFNFDYTEREFATGLPVFPNIGFRAEF
ncbi:MAG: TonB-dependent receptor [Myxococcales bacterium]|nr:TonB-dependent receptor [Myxococcales bacterium]